jgi:GAF domain-containing protein
MAVLDVRRQRPTYQRTAMADEGQLLAALRRYARSMSSDYDLSDVLYRLTDDVTTVLGIAGAGIALADEEARLRYATASSDDVVALEQVQEEHQEGPCMDAFRTQTVVTVADIAGRPDWAEYRKEAGRLGFHAVAGVPLSLGAERLGALNLYDTESREWSADDLDVVRVLADMAAGYMVHERLEDSRRRTEQLQRALDTRVLIEQAKGILSAAMKVSVDEAFELLRHYSRNNNTSLRVIAEAVVRDGFRPTR